MDVQCPSHPPLFVNPNNICWTIKIVNFFSRYVILSGRFLFYYLVCEAIGTAATPGLLCQPRVIVKMVVEKQMECRSAGETEVLGENLPQRHFCPSQNPTWPDLGLNPGGRGGKPATNRLSYGAASTSSYFILLKFKYPSSNLFSNIPPPPGLGSSFYTKDQ
jgi:hypothetical protein